MVLPLARRLRPVFKTLAIRRQRTILPSGAAEVPVRTLEGNVMKRAIGSAGVLNGLRGSGSLTGEPIDNGIFDHYTGWIVS